MTLPDGSRVTYEVSGNGPPILAMPGGPGLSSRYLRTFAEPLLDQFTWYLIDPPGTGGSTTTDDYSIGAHVNFYRRTVEALGLSQTYVFGHSYSGIVATVFTLDHPDVAIGCIVAAPPVVGTEVDANEGGHIRAAMNTNMERHADQPWYDDAVDAEFNPDPDHPVESLRRGLPLYFSQPSKQIVDHSLARLGPMEINMEPMMWFYGKEWNTLDLRPSLPEVLRPLLALVGEHDWAVPPIQAKHYESVPEGTVMVFPNCGHFVQFEATDAYRKSVIEWLKA
jgi:proline iminopeptidase